MNSGEEQRINHGVQKQHVLLADPLHACADPLYHSQSVMTNSSAPRAPLLTVTSLT